MPLTSSTYHVKVDRTLCSKHLDVCPRNHVRLEITSMALCIMIRELLFWMIEWWLNSLAWVILCQENPICPVLEYVIFLWKVVCINFNLWNISFIYLCLVGWFWGGFVWCVFLFVCFIFFFFFLITWRSTG